MFKKFTVVAVAAAALVIGAMHVGGSTASADGPAQHINTEQCFNFSFGQFCVKQDVVSHRTTTPSGNVNDHTSGETCTRFVVGGVTRSESCRRFNRVFHTRDGQLQVSHLNEKGESQFTAGGVTTRCTFRTILHYANGELRHADSDVECNPV